MCTAFVIKGKDMITGFNLDINAGAFGYRIAATDEYFGVQLDVSDASGIYRGMNGCGMIQGVNRNGAFATQLNNMGCTKAPYSEEADTYPLYLLIDEYITGKIDYEKLMDIANKKRIVNLPQECIDIPYIAMHSLIADRAGHILMLEPGNGYSVISEKYAVLSNFPMIELADDFCEEKYGYFGKDRYDRALDTLKSYGDDFSVQDGLRLLDSVKQTGEWATRVSFVYSASENAVYYALSGDFSKITRHAFE